MCGIVGYVGNKNISTVLLAGLERLSYRGYDSSGIGVISQGEINYWKKAGKLKELRDAIQGLSITGSAGIGHTRWATHGIPNDTNSHPHISGSQVAIVHNGIIENFEELRKEIIKKNYVLSSDTDSELIAHLLNDAVNQNDNLLEAILSILVRLEGSFAIAALIEGHDQEIFCMRKNMPLIIGIGENENFISSDIQNLLYHTHQIIELEDGEIAFVKKDQVKIYNQAGKVVTKSIRKINWKPSEEGKGGYPHYMLKEIYEQPDVVREILNRYVKKDKCIDFFSNFHHDSSVIDFAKIERFIIQACGTSWHAGLIAKYWIENYARILVEVDISSELRYRNIFTRPGDIVLALSQSGETADTLACLREAKSHFMKAISFVNVRESSIDREADMSIYSLAGREVGVASTKNYIAQLVTLYLFALYVGKEKNFLEEEYLEQQIY